MSKRQAKLLRFVDDNRIELNALFNVLVVGSVSFGAVFSVVEVDADIRTGWTWWEILRNIPADNLAAVYGPCKRARLLHAKGQSISTQGNERSTLSIRCSQLVSRQAIQE